MLHYSLKVFFQSHHDLQKRILCDLPVSACIRTAHTALDNPTDFCRSLTQLTHICSYEEGISSKCLCMHKLLVACAIGRWFSLLLFLQCSISNREKHANSTLWKNITQVKNTNQMKNDANEEYKNDANECHCATNGWASLKSSLRAYNNLSQ